MKQRLEQRMELLFLHNKTNTVICHLYQIKKEFMGFTSHYEQGIFSGSVVDNEVSLQIMMNPDILLSKDIVVDTYKMESELDMTNVVITDETLMDFVDKFIYADDAGRFIRTDLISTHIVNFSSEEPKKLIGYCGNLTVKIDIIWDETAEQKAVKDELDNDKQTAN